jgi:hypothetical protein
VTAAEAGLKLSAWVVPFVISLTVLFSVSFGIIAAYGAVNGILHLFASHKTAVEPQPVLMARNAQAGAD